MTRECGPVRFLVAGSVTAYGPEVCFILMWVRKRLLTGCGNIPFGRMREGGGREPPGAGMIFRHLAIRYGLVYVGRNG